MSVLGPIGIIISTTNVLQCCRCCGLFPKVGPKSGLSLKVWGNFRKLYTRRGVSRKFSCSNPTNFKRWPARPVLQNISGNLKSFLTIGISRLPICRLMILRIVTRYIIPPSLRALYKISQNIRSGTEVSSITSDLWFLFLIFWKRLGWDSRLTEQRHLPL